MGIIARITVLLFVVAICSPGHSLTPMMGPYHFTLPVIDLEPTHLPTLKKIFARRFGHNVSSLAVKDGMIDMYAGGEGPKSLLELGDLSAALKEAGLEIDPRTWVLKEQEMGFCLSTRGAVSGKELERRVESFADADIKVLGTLLTGSRMCLVVHIGEIEYAGLLEHLKKNGLDIDDLLWGHWKYGWGIEGHDDHRHELGMRLRHDQAR